MDLSKKYNVISHVCPQRFGVEGCEAVLVGLESLVARCAQHGVRRIELGMPHRGRLNVLCNILKKPPGALYGEMEGGQSEFHVGDVKYHLGQSASLEFGAEVSVVNHPPDYAHCISACTCMLSIACAILPVQHTSFRQNYGLVS